MNSSQLDSLTIEAIRNFPTPRLERLFDECVQNPAKIQGARHALIAAQICLARGSPHAAAFMGHAYFTGFGVKKDLKLARRWYSRAAKQAHYQALCWMGYASEYGIGCARRSPATAFKFYLAAANKKNVTAMFNLAQCFHEGKGVESDPKLAVFWWRKAADYSDANALCNLAVAYENALGTRRNRTKAFKLYQAAYDAGDRLAGWNLGRCYVEGIGVEQNIRVGRRLMMQFQSVASRAGSNSHRRLSGRE
ncbi:MAG: sel1 repeat family protein [Verrucomicrobia bacterium]|nr:sel1 repeat family protein [Verrucomicrobiota bacterium]